MTPSGGPSAGHAVVTGVSSGIGAVIAARLLRDGWSVTGLSRTNPGQHAPGFSHRAVDLLDPSQLPAALEGLRPTALVHAAGLMRAGSLAALDAEAGRTLWRLHVEAASLLADRLVSEMPDGGRIVLIGSRTASGAAGRGQYAASKAALVALARSWALELAPRGITVNVVAPGFTRSGPRIEGYFNALPPERQRPRQAPTKLGRWAELPEIASAVGYLVSEEASYCIGAVLDVNGGSFMP